MSHKQTTLKEANQAGREAFRQGKPYTTNPYSREHDYPCYLWWSNGWNEACDEASRRLINNRYNPGD